MHSPTFYADYSTFSPPSSNFQPPLLSTPNLPSLSRWPHFLFLRENRCHQTETPLKPLAIPINLFISARSLPLSYRTDPLRLRATHPPVLASPTVILHCDFFLSVLVYLTTSAQLRYPNTPHFLSEGFSTSRPGQAPCCTLTQCPSPFLHDQS